ncbi:MAG: hypothetical protein A2Y81_03565 [Nitrospirae bacterium RBG_13_43_8]|nr:MAG: hypothetical protein A2Y81_03565 [Nitrospirae bacterium RBG_13_43_8]
MRDYTNVASHKYLYLICHSCESRNPEPKPLDSRFHGNDVKKLTVFRILVDPLIIEAYQQ